MARKKKHIEDAHPDERWLLTYADMLTLLCAVFIVMYAISSVNVSKAENLRKSLESAFSGAVFTGGQTIKETGAQTEVDKLSSAPAPSLQAAFAPNNPQQSASAAAEQESLLDLKMMIEAEARRQGIASKVETELRPDGLLVRMKTDGVFFDPGQATLKPSAEPLVRRFAQLLRADGRHAVQVSGHTDSMPINGPQFPSNWELSTARASAMVRALIRRNVAPARLTATGRAFHDPVATNATAKGRAANRRVELFLPRAHASS